MRHGIPAKGLVGLLRQPDIIGKRHGPSRTEALLAVIACLPCRLGLPQVFLMKNEIRIIR